MIINLKFDFLRIFDYIKSVKTECAKKVTSLFLAFRFFFWRLKKMGYIIKGDDPDLRLKLAEGAISCYEGELDRKNCVVNKEIEEMEDRLEEIANSNKRTAEEEEEFFKTAEEIERRLKRLLSISSLFRKLKGVLIFESEKPRDKRDLDKVYNLLREYEKFRDEEEGLIV